MSLRSLLTRKPAPQPTEPTAADRLFMRLQDPAEFYAHVTDPANADEAGIVAVPLLGTQAFLTGVEIALERGDELLALNLYTYQDTADYDDALLVAIERLIKSRMINGYPGTDMQPDSNYETAQRICGRFLVAVNGFTIRTAAGRSITVVEDFYL